MLFDPPEKQNILLFMLTIVMVKEVKCTQLCKNFLLERCFMYCTFLAMLETEIVHKLCDGLP